MTITMNEADTGIVAAAEELVPFFRKNSLKVDEQRRLPDENIEALADLGVFRMTVPKRFGGYETPLPTICKVLVQLGRGCGSTAWISAATALSAWMVAHFPDSVQEEVFATENVRLSGSFAPSAELTPVDGGYRLNGAWAYNTGCLHSHWNIVSARLPGPDGMAMKLCVVPMSELSITDDWFTSGLRGTGSCTTVAKDVFVAADRVLDQGPFLDGTWVEGCSNVGTALYEAPTWPTFLLLGGGTVVPGVARAGLDVFEKRIVGRPITYTDFKDQSQTAPAQLDVATSAVRVETAELLSSQLADTVWDMALNSVDPDMLERQRMRATTGFLIELSRQAVETMTRSSGASSIRSDCFTQQIFRDMEALCMHAALNTTTLYESYGRARLGLPPVSNLA